jgi:DNA-binding NtrC family response regulator
VSLRELVRECLEDCGYTVLDARHGADAFERAAGHKGKVHLLMTDVVMPGIGGRDLAEKLAPHHPGLRVLYMSGYTDDAVVHHGVLAQEMDFLQKPFTQEALAKKVREVLDRPAEATSM